MSREKEQILLRAMSDIDDELIEDARREGKLSSHRWVRWGALAACLALLALSTPLLFRWHLAVMEKSEVGRDHISGEADREEENKNTYYSSTKEDGMVEYKDAQELNKALSQEIDRLWAQDAEGRYAEELSALRDRLSALAESSADSKEAETEREALWEEIRKLQAVLGAP